MSKRCMLFLHAILSFGALGGCGIVDSKECTEELRVHTIDMTREVTTSEPLGALVVEACMEGACRSATPDASGRVTFATELGALGPRDGSVATAADPARKTVTVSYAVPEQTANGTFELQLRVKSGATTILDEQATVRWADDDCHPEPLATKL